MKPKLPGWTSRTIALGLFVALGAVAARAADTPAPGKADVDFLNDAASGGLMEVELGRYAASHAASPEVKRFGQHMVDDHSKANEELKRVAAQESVQLPATPKPEHQERVSRLTKLQGAAFDRAYMDAMVKDHEEDVAKFRDVSRSADDPQVKAFAAKTLPTLEKHLAMAKDVAAQTGGATSGARPAP
jgi:putative membrane protein